MVQDTNAPSRQREGNSLCVGVPVKGGAWVHRARLEHSVGADDQSRRRSLWNETGSGLKSWIHQPTNSVTLRKQLTSRRLRFLICETGSIGSLEDRTSQPATWLVQGPAWDTALSKRQPF